ERDEVDRRQRLRDQLDVDRPADDRRKALVQGGRERDLALGPVGQDRVRAEDIDDGIRLRDQGLDARPELLEIVDVAAVDQAVEAVGLELRLEPIRKGQVLAGVGDENLRVRRGASAVGLRAWHDGGPGRSPRLQGFASLACVVRHWQALCPWNMRGPTGPLCTPYVICLGTVRPSEWRRRA